MTVETHDATEVKEPRYVECYHKDGFDETVPEGAVKQCDACGATLQKMAGLIVGGCFSSGTRIT